LVGIAIIDGIFTMDKLRSCKRFHMFNQSTINTISFMIVEVGDVTSQQRGTYSSTLANYIKYFWPQKLVIQEISSS
jgi:hypothetical protein